MTRRAAAVFVKAVCGVVSIAGVVGACSSFAERPTVAPTVVEQPPPIERIGEPVVAPATPGLVSQAVEPCDVTIPVYRGGEPAEETCFRQLHVEGLTRLDLSDTWAPPVFPSTGSVDEERTFRPYYVALANEARELPEWFRVSAEKYLELYGIFPSLSVLRGRAGEVNDCPSAGTGWPELANAEANYRRTWLVRKTSRFSAREERRWRQRLERVQRRLGFSDLSELEEHPRHGPLLAQLRERERLRALVARVQTELACEGFLPRYLEGTFDTRTWRALKIWQRKNMIIARGELDPWTREVMILGAQERLYRAGLRVLRERVVAATGLIEDGSAGAGQERVLDRWLDPPEVRVGVARAPLPDGAPDLISRFTERAAQELGWTDAERFVDLLSGMPDGATASWVVALPLPTLPAYHAPHMELRAEIDRGDVRRTRARDGDRRPTIVLFAELSDGRVALLRWNTTIGGWQNERLDDGRIIRSFKESPVGPRVWRDVLASPVWFPPASTPDGELVRGQGDRSSVKWSLLGPGPRSAYGLLMVMHHRVMGTARDGSTRLQDEGIRVHGSVSYRSILTGTSHGCHRLYNHLALRLGAFLIGHREHEDIGPLVAEYRRTVTVPTVTEQGDDANDETGEGVEPDPRTLGIRLNNRGHLFRLEPPVPVEVLEGTIHGRRR